MARWVGVKEWQLMLGLLGLIGLLLVLSHLLPRLATGYVLLAWGALWLPLLALLFLRRRVARRVWLTGYLRDGSPWFGRLRGGPLMLLGQALVAGLLALALLSALARGVSASTWMVLVLCVPLWALGWRALARYLERHVAPRYLAPITGDVLRRIGGVVLLLVLATWALWQPYPDLGGVTLYEAVRFFAARQQAESVPLRHLLEVAAALDGGRHWLAQHWLDGLPGLALQLAAWLVVLVQEWLFVWPFLLLCQAVGHIIHGHEDANDTDAARH